MKVLLQVTKCFVANIRSLTGTIQIYQSSLTVDPLHLYPFVKFSNASRIAIVVCFRVPIPSTFYKFYCFKQVSSHFFLFDGLICKRSVT